MRPPIHLLQYSLIYASSLCVSFADKETLLIGMGSGDKNIDTVAILVDYSAPAKVPPSGGSDWEDYEMDSAWTAKDSVPDSENGGFIYFDSKRVQYRHFFHAVKNGKNGVGEDRITYITRYKDAPEYNATISFSFLLDETMDDTVETWVWDSAHFKDNGFLEGDFSGGIKAGNGHEGELQRVVAGGGIVPPPRLLLIDRKAGWNDQTGLVNARPVSGGVPQGGWFPASGAKTQLRVPEGARILRVFDAQGRMHWEKPLPGHLMEVEVPGGLPAVPLRYQWTVAPR